MKQRISVLVALLVVLSMVLSACGGGAAPAAAPAETAAAGDAAATTTEAAAAAAPAASGEAVTIEYWLWDANQLPAYQACADAFMAANPNIKVNLTQAGWNDYWNNVQTGMVAGTAPDIFTNHLAKYPEFAAKEQLVDIQPFIERDGVLQFIACRRSTLLMREQNIQNLVSKQPLPTAYATQCLALLALK